MVSQNLMRLILLCVIMLLPTDCNNDVNFTRIIIGRTWTLQGNDSSWYVEDILVKNIPRNNMKESKIMIAYFDSMGLSMDDLSMMPEIRDYNMFFYRSTRATRRYFIEKNTNKAYNANKTYLGNILVGRCGNNSTKWMVSITRNLGTEPDADYVGCKTKDEFLQNECDPSWYETNKNNELVRYYMELKGKK
jgi:hypothetical protein